jgi:hypothetical protein
MFFDEKTAPYHVQFESFGVGIRICTNTPELLKEVEAMIPASARRARLQTDRRLGLVSDDAGNYQIYRYDGAPVHDAPGRDYALIMMESQIHGHIALEAEDYVFIHAGVVGDGRRVMVIPGMSFSGKTTLVRALVEAGAVYYSDEYAVIDSEGLVHPYPRNLSVRPLLVGDSTTLTAPPVEMTSEQLGGTTGVDPLPVGLVVATHYRPGAQWAPRELSGGERVLALFQHAVPARERPEQTLRYIKNAVSDATALEGERGDADEVAAAMLEMLRSAA